MADVVVALLAAVLGGLLVLGGNVVVRRSEDRHWWAQQVQRSAADLAGNFAAGRSAVMGARLRGEPLPDEEKLGYLERNRLRGHLLCTPGAEVLIDRIEQLHGSFQALVDAYEEGEGPWEEAVIWSRRAMTAFEAEVRSTVDQQRTLLGWRPRGGRISSAEVDRQPASELPQV